MIACGTLVYEVRTERRNTVGSVNSGSLDDSFLFLLLTEISSAFKVTHLAMIATLVHAKTP